MEPKKKQVEAPKDNWDPSEPWGGNEDPNYSDPAERDWSSEYDEHLKEEAARKHHKTYPADFWTNPEKYREKGRPF